MNNPKPSKHNENKKNEQNQQKKNTRTRMSGAKATKRRTSIQKRKKADNERAQTEDTWRRQTGSGEETNKERQDKRARQLDSARGKKNGWVWKEEERNQAHWRDGT
jgi:hypothetical protein